MSLKKYEHYKNTTVDWIGSLPVDWKLVPLKHIATFTNGAAFKPTDWSEYGFPIIRIENLNGGETFNYFSGEPEERYLVNDGDLLFGWSGNRGTSFGPFRWSREEICVLNQHIFKVESLLVERDSLYWMLRAVTAHVEDHAHGIIGMVHITKGALGAIVVPLPSVQERKAIAAFLDAETSKIDALVAEQRRLIELLKEKWQAVISHAVTKGLNPHVKMKPSGIDWLGEVPEHWDCRRLSKLSTKITNGYVGPTRDILVESGVPYVQATHIKNGVVNFDGSYYVTEPWSKAHSKSILAEGDVLIVQTGAGTGDVGVVTRNEIGFNCHALIIVQGIPNVLNGAFLCALLRSDYGNQTLFSLRTGGMHPHLNCSNIRDITIPVPPIDEQRAIVAFLDDQISEFSSLIENSELSMSLLQERRTALISAAVTGKIDVRGFVKKGEQNAALCP
jgi:type I restriction enzyme, S subunit